MIQLGKALAKCDWTIYLHLLLPHELVLDLLGHLRVCCHLLRHRGHLLLMQCRQSCLRTLSGLRRLTILRSLGGPALLGTLARLAGGLESTMQKEVFGDLRCSASTAR